MGFSPAVRVAAMTLLALCLAGLVWRGVVIYRADQRAQRAAAIARETPVPVTKASLKPVTANEGPQGGGPVSPKSPSEAPPVKRLTVHVEGAVARPGVYTLDEGSRVNDAILAAGGAGPEAMPGALNLAAPLTDGAKVYVFTRAELQPAASPPPAAQEASYPPVTATQAATASPAQTVMVNLNTATAAELEAVPGIGPATARAIIEHRTKHGAFRRVDDLTAVSGIGPKTLEKLRPYLKV